ncbi:MAG: GNAT family acetyltransferase, partial [Cyclobacteriaceae bacterium]
MINYLLADPADIDSVLTLQAKHLASNLTEEEKRQGFVTTPFTETQLLEIIAQRGLFIAKDDHQLFSYLFAGNWRYFSQWKIFTYMISRFPQLSFKGLEITTENSFQYGPVCIDHAYRSKGHFNQLFEKMRLEFVKTYPISITFINQVNEISTAAHTR